MSDHLDQPFGQSEANAATVATGPKGLGGWLILPLLHFAVLPLAYPILFAIGIAQELRTNPAEGGGFLDASDLAALLSLSLSDWLQIIASDPGSFTEMATALALLVPVLGLWVLSIVCLVQLLRKSSAFPTLAIIYYAAALAFAVVYLALSHAQVIASTPAEQRLGLKDAVRSFWAALIWINYFRLSKRVKNTFVN